MIHGLNHSSNASSSASLNRACPFAATEEDDAEALAFLESFVGAPAAEARETEQTLSLSEMLEMQAESAPPELVQVTADHAIRQIELLVKNNPHIFQNCASWSLTR